MTFILTEIEYEAPESLVSGLILICLTSLPSVTEYSVVLGWNFGVSFPGETESFSKSALSIMHSNEIQKGPGKRIINVFCVTSREIAPAFFPVLFLSF